MVDTGASGTPTGAPARKTETETVPLSANPSTNRFGENIHGFKVPSRDLYSDGVQIPMTIVTPLDITTNPMTYTMPCTSAIVPGARIVQYASTLCTSVAATTVITPAANKRYRLLGFVLAPDAGLAAAGVELISFVDELAGDTGIDIQTYLPAAGGIVHQSPIVVNLPNEGYLSSTNGKKLQITLGTAVTAGAISVTVMYTSE